MKTLSSLIAVALLVGCGKDDEETPADPCEESGNICTFAGVPQMAQFGPEDIPAVESPLYLPQDITFAPDGTGYLPDFNNHRIRMIDTDGIISTVAGTGFLGDGPEGDAAIAAWNHPTNIAVDPNNPSVLHVAAWHNSRINMIDLAAGTVTFECGTGGRAYSGDGGPCDAADLDLPSSVAFDDLGNLYLTDQANQMIRKVDTAGTITGIAGQSKVTGYVGDGGPASDALLFAQVGQAADPSNKMDIDGRVLYFADSGNNVVRMVDLDSGVIDGFAGAQWTTDTAPSDKTAGDGGAATAATLNNPRDVAVGIDGEVYIADTDNHCIRVVRDGTIDTFAGTCGTTSVAPDFVGEEEPATDALLNKPYGIAVDPDGNVYISDTQNHVIRRVKY